MKRFEVARFDEVAAVRCPCGEARRAFLSVPGGPASMHVVEIWEDSRTHYHKKTTELYYVLEGEGKLEADGEEIALRPGAAVLIKPGCRHRAVGKLRILNVPVPAFDPGDEWFDPEE